MSLLSKIFSKKEVSRRDCLDTLCEIVGFAFGVKLLHSTLYSAQSSLRFISTPFIRQNLWVRKELTDFLNQEEVEEVLGFDPLNYNKPIILEVGEEVKDIPRFYDDKPTNFGYTYFNGNAWINAYYFSYKDPISYLTSQKLKRQIGKELKQEDYQKYITMLTELRKDLEMIKLYRGISLVHELAHIRERYSLMEESIVTLTDHGFTGRIEIKLLASLYKSGKVDIKTCEKIINFFEKYLNSEQPQHEIDAYLRTNFNLRK